MGREVLFVSALTRTLSPILPVCMICALTAMSPLSVCIPTSPVMYDGFISAQHCMCASEGLMSVTVYIVHTCSSHLSCLCIYKLSAL